MKKVKANKKIHFIHLMGGLGNQLFQIAAGLSFEHEFESKLIIDDSFGNFRKNIFGKADVFSYQNKFISTSGVFLNNKSFLNRNISLLIRISLKSKMNFIYKISKNMLILASSLLLSLRNGKILRAWCANSLGYEEIPKSKQSKYLIGYFQTYKFAMQEEVQIEMRSLSIVSDSINEYKHIALTEKPLVVHVRLGDYQNEVNFGVLSPEYYNRSVSLMISEFNFKHIWVFSDEIEKAKSFIPKQYLDICRWVTDINDSAAVTLEKMRLGNGYVIANSSLSWWGSFLTYTQGAPIIAPDPWFTGMDDPKDLIPENWIKISRE